MCARARGGKHSLFPPRAALIVGKRAQSADSALRKGSDMSYWRINFFVRSDQVEGGAAKLARRLIVNATLAGLLLPGSATAENDQATCYKKAGDVAIAACTSVIASGDKSHSETAQAHVARGVAYFKKGNYDQAIKDFDYAIELDPTNPFPFYDRGTVESSLGLYDKAIVDYSNAIQLNSTYASAFNNRCFAYNARAQAGDYDQAVRDCRSAIKLSPSQSNPYLGLGNALSNKGENEEALKQYDEAIARDANSAKAFLGRCNTNITIKKYDLAIEDCGRDIQIDPSDPIGWNNSCWVLAVVGQLDSALQHCNRAVELQRDPYSLDSKAFTLLKMGSFDEAIANYNQALLLQPRRASSLYGRGYAKLKKGDIAAANEDMGAATLINQSIAEQFRQNGVQ
jgi:tetratricopeptide (TPR) repeat protein